jgi:Flp pilus assembly protein TadG
VVIRNPSRSVERGDRGRAGSRRARRGAVSLQMLVILVPLLFAFMGFAIDLGRMYMIRGELKTAADAMALAAAARLIGTEASLEEARAAAQLGVDEAGGFANRYDYGGLRIGATTGRLSSEISEPS